MKNFMKAAIRRTTDIWPRMKPCVKEKLHDPRLAPLSSCACDYCACFGLVTYVGSGRVGQTSDAILRLGGVADMVRSKFDRFCHVMTPPWWLSLPLCHSRRVWFGR